MPEPAYSFSLPSLHDRTLLDCRLYHPKKLQTVLAQRPDEQCVQAAIVAHPYAPLGGCFDDAVVLSVTKTLLEKGFVVGTFNFRGATGSPGNTSLTGKAEQADYETFIGFVITYCRTLLSSPAAGEDPDDEQSQPPAAEPRQAGYIELLLAGYSYGSLVLARLQPASVIAKRFRDTLQETVECEIISTANTIATEARRHLVHPYDSCNPQASRSHEAAGARNERSTASSVTMGDEQVRRSRRKRIREGKRSTETQVESPGREQDHGSGDFGDSRQQSDISEPRAVNIEARKVTISARYLLISPVILPFTHSLCPPGSPSSIFGRARSTASSGAGPAFLDHPTLAVFGSKDVFTSSHRLRGWAEKQSNEARSTFEWAEIETAGHFWSEEGVMQALQQRVLSWTRSVSQD